MPAHHHRGQRRIGFVDGVADRLGARRFLYGDARDRRRRPGDLAEILVDPGVELRRVEIARDDEDRIVGAVIRGVEGADVVDRCGFQILDAADRRARIGMRGIGGGRQIGGEQLAIGPRERRLAQFLLHHVALGGEALRLDDEARHAIGLGEQQALQVVGGDHLIVIGEIVVGRGVVIAADILGQPIHLFGDEVARRLEHEVFEHVREARPAARIVLRADIVPDLYRDVGRAGVTQRIDAQPVGQRPLGKGDRLDRRGVGAGGGGLGGLGSRGEGQERGPEQQGGTNEAHGSGLRLGRWYSGELNPWQGRCQSRDGRWPGAGDSAGRPVRARRTGPKAPWPSAGIPAEMAEIAPLFGRLGGGDPGQSGRRHKGAATGG